jgi:ribosomal protein S18 acetylase RimI-like enzyme
MFRPAEKHESSYLVEQASKTEPWKPGEAEELLGGVLEAYFTGQLGDGHFIGVWENQNKLVVAWSYYAANPHAPGVWDVWWIGTDPSLSGRGYGTKLLSAIERDISMRSGRVIVIETSATPPLARARRFYPRLGYLESGRISNFYGPGEDKIIFAKSL